VRAPDGSTSPRTPRWLRAGYPWVGVAILAVHIESGPRFGIRRTGMRSPMRPKSGDQSRRAESSGLPGRAVCASAPVYFVRRVAAAMRLSGWSLAYRRITWRGLWLFGCGEAARCGGFGGSPSRRPGTAWPSSARPRSTSHRQGSCSPIFLSPRVDYLCLGSARRWLRVGIRCVRRGSRFVQGSGVLSLLSGHSCLICWQHRPRWPRACGRNAPRQTLLPGAVARALAPVPPLVDGRLDVSRIEGLTIARVHWLSGALEQQLLRGRRSSFGRLAWWSIRGAGGTCGRVGQPWAQPQSSRSPSPHRCLATCSRRCLFCACSARSAIDRLATPARWLLSVGLPALFCLPGGLVSCTIGGEPTWTAPARTGRPSCRGKRSGARTCS